MSQNVINDKNRYGFKINLHARPSDIPYRSEWVEKYITKKTTTAHKLVIGVVIAILIIFLAANYLTKDTKRAEFMALPILIITGGALLLLWLYTFVDESGRSLLYLATTIITSYFEQIKRKHGKLRINRRTGVNTVDVDGLLHFDNGDVGYVFLVDGSTSLTAFPKEVKRQELICRQYQSGRRRTTTEIHITSSQLQDASEQLKHLSDQFSSTNNDSAKALLNQQYQFINKSINGIKSTIVQYLLIRDTDMQGLSNSFERLKRFENQGLYYSLIQLKRDHVTSVLNDIFSLR